MSRREFLNNMNAIIARQHCIDIMRYREMGWDVLQHFYESEVIILANRIIERGTK